MTLAFWDSSALVKLLIDEPGTDIAVALSNRSTYLAASRLVVPELSAALAAAERGGRIDRGLGRVARNEWHRYRTGLNIIELSEAIADHAAILAITYPLSGADSVHLASVLTLRDDGLVLASWDNRLRAAALAEGLTVLPGHS